MRRVVSGFFSFFLRRQRHCVLKIDLASEAENVYSCRSLCVLWSRPLSSIQLKTHTLLYGFRDSTSDLHLAEHKWVRRKNTEQSPLLTPPGARGGSYNQPRHCSCRAGRMSSTSPTRLPVGSNGVGHQALLKMEKKRNKYWFENVLFCYFQKLSSVFFFFSLWTRCRASGHGWGFSRMFCDQCSFLSTWVCMGACVCAHACIKSCQPPGSVRGGRRVVYLTKCSQ